MAGWRLRSRIALMETWSVLFLEDARLRASSGEGKPSLGNRSGAAE